MKIAWEEYTTIEQLEKDIKSIKIQGATNVALAVVRGMELVVQSYTHDIEKMVDNVVQIGQRLAEVRTNEPLARNAVKYIQVFSKIKGGSTSKEELGTLVSQLNAQYLNLVEVAKNSSLKYIDQLPPTTHAYTHCHSSTVEKLLKGMSDKQEGFKVACSETRPIYQGRITAQNLLNSGVDTTLVVDSAAAPFVADRSYFPIDTVFIGADEITLSGDVINKVGSFGIALAAYYSSTPIYVVASLLKMNPNTAFSAVQIEQRNPLEVWENPPKDLKIYNPAFDLVPNKLITGYITEVGIVKPEDMARKLHETYDWVF